MTAETTYSGNTATAARDLTGAPRRLRTISITEQITEQLCLEILNGQRQSGERIGEEDVAAYFGVSRAPVREAIRNLERRGLAEVFPRRGAFVKAFSVDGIADVLEVRGVMFGLAARLCAQRQSATRDSAAGEILADLTGMADKPDVDARRFGIYSSRFYAALVHLSGNSHLNRALKDNRDSMIWVYIWRNFELEFQTSERRHVFLADAAQALDLIAAGQAAEAESAIRALYNRTVEAALAAFRAGGTPVPLRDQGR